MSNQEPIVAPEIDYLSKDYASFRQLMLDHLASLVPDWTERNPSDLGNALTDLLAYAADYLSYYQDAVATEAYLGTARLRRSIKRHTRLLDYRMHEGCNARVLVHLELDADHVHFAEYKAYSLPRGTRLLTRVGQVKTVIAPASPEDDKAMAQQPLVFETMHDVRLHPGHNEMHFVAAGSEANVLPRGATQAVLRPASSSPLCLQAGDFLIFEEIRDPATGEPQAADPARRHAVRLTAAWPAPQASSAWEITWQAADALPFDMILHRYEGDERQIPVTVARGNVVLADHGNTARRLLPVVGPGRYTPRLVRLDLTYAEPLAFAAGPTSAPDSLVDVLPPSVGTYAPLPEGVPASKLLVQEPRRGMPSVWLYQRGRRTPLPRNVGLPQPVAELVGIDVDTAGAKRSLLTSQYGLYPLYDEISGLAGYLVIDPGRGRHFLLAKRDPRDTHHQLYDAVPWQVEEELLSSEPFDRAFVVETTEQGYAFVRFGFKGMGWQPSLGDQFAAVFRVGNGSAGNIGPEAIAHVVTASAQASPGAAYEVPGAAQSGDPSVENVPIKAVRNPLPGVGGRDRELVATARLFAPTSFQTQARCVTIDDYVTAAMQHPGVAEASAEQRWTGSWYTTFIYVRRADGRPVDRAFQEEVRAHMETFRLTGEDIQVRGPRFVPLYITLKVFIRPDSSRAQITERLLQAFSFHHRGHPDCFFHPQRFRLGQTVYPSEVIACAMAVDGVVRATISHFSYRPVSSDDQARIDAIQVRPTFMIRLDDNPDRPEFGRLECTVAREAA